MSYWVQKLKSLELTNCKKIRKKSTSQYQKLRINKKN